MRAIDAWAIETRGIPSLDLMERAGEGLARVIGEHVPSGRIAVVCGKGNNGGDGLVAARLLRRAGRDVDVLLTSEPDALSEDAGAQLARLPGAAPARYSAARLSGAAGLVDALLGTGATGAPRGASAGVIEDLNGARAPVIAADVPSGVDAGTGEVAGAAVRAVATATFHAAMPGLWIAPGKTHAGAVQRDRHRDPGGRARRRRRRADHARRAARRAAPRARLDQVQLRQRRDHRRLARADRRADDGRARRRPRRRRLRHRRRGRERRALVHDAPARGDVQGPARRGRGADAGGDRRGRRGGRARRRGRAGARARPQSGRAGARPRARPADRRPARDRRRRAERHGRAGRGAAPAPLADDPHPARGRAGAAAGGRRGGDRARPPAPCPRGGRAGEGADRAQGGRHAGGRPVGARGDLAGRRAGAGHRGHGRRPLRA